MTLQASSYVGPTWPCWNMSTQIESLHMIVKHNPIMMRMQMNQSAKLCMLLEIAHVAQFVTVAKHKASDQWSPTSCPH